jgi:hypothetical protein
VTLAQLSTDIFLRLDDEEQDILAGKVADLLAQLAKVSEYDQTYFGLAR